MNIGITGATGFLGGVTGEMAKRDGHRLTAFSRSVKSKVSWAGVIHARPEVVPADLRGLDAVIHFAGENIFGRWSKAKKERIRRSRIVGTRTLVHAIGELPPEERPKVLVCASGAAFYGDRGDTVLDDKAAKGEGFLADVTLDWESEAFEAESRGLRVVCLRQGMVLGKTGGALPLMAKMFRFGLGGKLGSGRQWQPWIHVEDMARLYLWAVQNETVSGPVNAVSPGEVTNAGFTKTLAQVLHRPAFLPAPAWGMRLVMGEMSSIALDSQRLKPQAVMSLGFDFKHENLENALKDVLE